MEAHVNTRVPEAAVIPGIPEFFVPEESILKELNRVKLTVAGPAGIYQTIVWPLGKLVVSILQPYNASFRKR